MKQIFFYIIYLGLISMSFAQNQSHEIGVRQYENKILIRWAPKTYKAWKNGIDSGYVLQRIEVSDLVNGANNWQILNSSTIKPMPLDLMKQKFGEKNMNAALAAQMIYGKTTVTNSEDLGDVIKKYKAEQENKLGFVLLACGKDFEVAKAAALAWEDKTYKGNVHYAYRLIAIGQDTIYGNINLSQLNGFEYNLPEVEVEKLEKSAHLRWPLEGYPFWGYYLEKKVKNDWIRTTSSPLIVINTVKDSIERIPIMIETEKYEQNYQKLQYRLVGIDDYGIENTGPIFLSFGVDKTAPSAPENAKALGIDEKTIRVEWKWENLLKSKDVIGFRIDKALNTDFYFLPYSTILPLNTRSFLDKSPEILGSNYYRVATIDTAGNESYSVFTYGMVFDSVAPSIPSNIKCSIDSNGVVNLTWDRPKEIDVFGYRVYFSNNANHAFINLTGKPIETNSYSDTISLKTLTKKAFYKIVALDFNYNHSKFSEAIEIKRPDKIKPQAPFFTNYYTDGNSIKLNWMRSFSDDAEAVVLRRKIAGQLEWTVIFKGKNQKDTFFEDKNVTRNTNYEYEIRVLDESGLWSDNEKTVSIKTIPLQTLEDVSALKAIYNKEKKQVELTWQYLTLKEHYFVIYKSLDGSKFEEIDFVDENNSYIDKSIKREQLYFYKIKPISRKGAAGIPCNAVKVKIE